MRNGSLRPEHGARYDVIFIVVTYSLQRDRCSSQAQLKKWLSLTDLASESSDLQGTSTSAADPRADTIPF